MSWKRWKEKEKIIKNAIKICTFILIAILPFLTITQLIGMETFLDSFENPEHYVCLQDKYNILGSYAKDGEFLIIQRSSHPDFSIKKSDSIIYCENNREIACNKVTQINDIGAIKRYRTSDKNDIISQPIYECQIIGKVIKVLDNNLCNSILIRVWETSIHNLNLRALFAED